MADSETFEFDWNISLLVQRIAADLMIQEGAVVNLQNTMIFERGIRRCQLHTRLLQLILQIKRCLANELEGSADLIKALEAIQASSADIAKVQIERSKPLMHVLCDKKIIDACLRMVVILLLLEDEKLKKIYVSMRSRSGYVSVKFIGGRSKNNQLAEREVVRLLEKVVRLSAGGVAWKSRASKRTVYIRLNLSNQLNLIE